MSARKKSLPPASPLVDTIVQCVLRCADPGDVLTRVVLRSLAEMNAPDETLWVMTLNALNSMPKANGDRYLDAWLSILSRGMTTDSEALKATQQAMRKALASGKPMSPERIETAEHYLTLRKELKKEARVLEAIVKLPGEQGKEYARKYAESGDYEALRSYVKSLILTYRNHL